MRGIEGSRNIGRERKGTFDDFTKDAGGCHCAEEGGWRLSRVGK